MTVQRKPAAPRSVMTSRSRSGHSARQRAGVANSAARTCGGTATNVSSTTSTDGTPDSYHPDRHIEDGRLAACVSTACPPPSASPMTRPSWTRCSPTPRATSPRSPTAAAAPTGSGATSPPGRSRPRSPRWRAASSPRASSRATGWRCSRAPATSGRLIDYAILAVGAATVPIYETSSAEQVRWILSDSGAVAVVVETAKHAALVEQVRDELGELKVWRIEPEGDEPGAVERLVARGADVPEDGGARAPRVGARRRPRHADLHLRHHRPSQGLRAHPPQHADRGALGRRAVPAAAHRGRLGAAVPAARARVRQGDPVRRHATRARSSGTPRTSRTWSAT